MPNSRSTLLTSPKRAPLKIDSRQIIDAITYEQAVGRKNADRKNAFATRTRFTSSASASEKAKVRGTMKTANTTNVPMLVEERLVLQQVGVVGQPHELGRA